MPPIVILAGRILLSVDELPEIRHVGVFLEPLFHVRVFQGTIVCELIDLFLDPRDCSMPQFPVLTAATGETLSDNPCEFSHAVNAVGAVIAGQA